MGMVKVCPKCGKDNDKDFLVCSKCGASLDNAEVVDAATYKKVPEPDVTTKTAATAQATNSVASILRVIAIITYVAAFICGIVLGEEFSFVIALVCWVAGFISGSMFLGFSEIIRLLHEINKKA